ncbi:MAG: hypothetical protein ACKVHA_01660 [Fidelibacterota bacterium]|jgi:hypothetical protein|tara:strand:+ start:1693 stop:1863 length:171 start_codon:yes stop_codon:yes gene_type:complete
MKKTIWLLLSSFGIMFAIISWAQESGVFASDLGVKKGLLAIFSGIILYVILPSRID